MLGLLVLDELLVLLADRIANPKKLRVHLEIGFLPIIVIIVVFFLSIIPLCCSSSSSLRIPTCFEKRHWLEVM